MIPIPLDEEYASLLEKPQPVDDPPVHIVMLPDDREEPAPQQREVFMLIPPAERRRRLFVFTQARDEGYQIGKRVVSVNTLAEYQERSLFPIPDHKVGTITRYNIVSSHSGPWKPLCIQWGAGGVTTIENPNDLVILKG